VNIFKIILSFMLVAVVAGMGRMALAQAPDSLDEILPGQEAGDRDPATVRSSAGKRTYVGGMDDDDLRVQKQIPEAAIRVDARSVQKEIYKKLYRQDMKDDRQETMEE
jgi:hypothetical protein